MSLLLVVVKVVEGAVRKLMAGAKPALTKQ